MQIPQRHKKNLRQLLQTVQIALCFFKKVTLTSVCLRGQNGTHADTKAWCCDARGKRTNRVNCSLLTLSRRGSFPPRAALRLHCARCNWPSLPLTPVTARTSSGPRPHCSFSRKRGWNDATQNQEGGKRSLIQSSAQARQEEKVEVEEEGWQKVTQGEINLDGRDDEKDQN